MDHVDQRALIEHSPEYLSSRISHRLRHSHTHTSTTKFPKSCLGRKKRQFQFPCCQLFAPKKDWFQDILGTYSSGVSIAQIAWGPGCMSTYKSRISLFIATIVY